MVDVLDTGTRSPRQALLMALEEVDGMKDVVIAYTDDNDVPCLTCSSMKPIYLHLLGTCVQAYALEILKE